MKVPAWHDFYDVVVQQSVQPRVGIIGFYDQRCIVNAIEKNKHLGGWLVRRKMYTRQAGNHH